MVIISKLTLHLPAFISLVFDSGGKKVLMCFLCLLNSFNCINVLQKDE